MEAIARICRESYEPYDARLQPADLQLFHAEFHAQNMNDPATRWVVLCQDGVPVGVAQWRMLPGVAHLHMLFVAGSAQGRGYGVRLLKHHQKEALREQRDIRLFTLHCMRDSVWAMRFYTHQGYTLYADGDEGHHPDLVLYIDACKAHDDAWPPNPAKALFYKFAR